MHDDMRGSIAACSASNLLVPGHPKDIGRVDRFDVGAKCHEQNTADGVLVALTSFNFRRDFSGKVEEAVGPMTFSMIETGKPADSMQIVAAIRQMRKERGIESVIRDTGLGQLWELLKLQGKGQPGRLPLGDTPIIAFTLNTHGVPTTVELFWKTVAAGWGFGSYAMQTDPFEFMPGTLVVSSYRTEYGTEASTR